MRRIGVLMLNDENDPAGKVNLAGFSLPRRRAPENRARLASGRNSFDIFLQRGRPVMARYGHQLCIAAVDRLRFSMAQLPLEGARLSEPALVAHWASFKYRRLG
jgi:hypothetical protein